MVDPRVVVGNGCYHVIAAEQSETQLLHGGILTSGTPLEIPVNGEVAERSERLAQRYDTPLSGRDRGDVGDREQRAGLGVGPAAGVNVEIDDPGWVQNAVVEMIEDDNFPERCSSSNRNTHHNNGNLDARSHRRNLQLRISFAVSFPRQPAGSSATTGPAWPTRERDGW